jgi:Fur family ferric uptake transcriptional regulator
MVYSWGNFMKNDQRPKVLPCGRSWCPEPEAPRAIKLGVWQDKLKRYLAEKGLKYSEQRWKIAEIILSSGGHLDAQTLVDKVREQHPGIGAATVYRNLKVLQDADILKESLTNPQGRTVFEVFDDEHHDHIVCVDCGGIFEFHSERIEAIQNEIISEMGFEPVRHRHVIYVNCRYKKAKT